MTNRWQPGIYNHLRARAEELDQKGIANDTAYVPEKFITYINQKRRNQYDAVKRNLTFGSRVRATITLAPDDVLFNLYPPVVLIHNFVDRHDNMSWNWLWLSLQTNHGYWLWSEIIAEQKKLNHDPLDIVHWLTEDTPLRDRTGVRFQEHSRNRIVFGFDSYRAYEEWVINWK